MDDAKTVWVGNIADQVTEELLYELFLQSGPLERVKIPTDREGRQSSFAFVTFKHEVSVPYAVQLLNGIKLCEKNLNIKPRSGGGQKDKYNALQSPMQRSFSYPNEAYNSPRNEHLRFDEPNSGPQHISFEDLLRMGPMMNVNHAYQDTNFDNDDFGNNFGHNRHQPERSSFRDRDRGRDRKDYNGPRNDRDRDRRHDFSNNSRRSNKRSNFDRSGGRRNHRYY